MTGVRLSDGRSPRHAANPVGSALRVFGVGVTGAVVSGRRFRPHWTGGVGRFPRLWWPVG